MNDFRRKCPMCSGEMVRSSSHYAGYTQYFWRKPWKKGIFDFSSEKVYPWACMSCGVVLLYLDRLPSVAEEYRTESRRGRLATGEPAPIKS
jgi:hypothetical protein